MASARRDVDGGNADTEGPEGLDATAVSHDDVIAMAFHDLKTPLAALRQALQILDGGRAGALTPPQARFVAMGLDNAHVLGSLVERLRETLSAKSGGDACRPRRVEAGAVAAFVLRALNVSAEARGVRLELRAGEEAPPAWADEELLRRLLLNLVGNAIKYAACGGLVVVRVEGGGPGFVAVKVSDRGPGIRDDERARVFETRFRCGGDSAREEGAGLGLAIVRDIARAHGGEARVQNNAGPGCTFTVTLPAFGSGAGLAAHAARLARRQRGAELIVLTARAGEAARLADALCAQRHAREEVLDLGEGRLAVLRRPPAGVRATLDELLALLGPHEDAVAAAGVAADPDGDRDVFDLIAAACASSRPHSSIPALSGT